LLLLPVIYTWAALSIPKASIGRTGVVLPSSLWE